MEKIQGEVEKTFETSYLKIDQENLRDFPIDPLSKEMKLEETHYLQTLDNLTGLESLRVFCIESAILHFIPDLSGPEEENFDKNCYKTVTMYVRDAPLLLCIVRTNDLLRGRTMVKSGWMFLFLARDIDHEDWIEHYLLWVRPVRDVFERCGVVRLSVQRTRLMILEELGLTGTRVFLIKVPR